MKVQTYNPKYICEYVDHSLYSRKGMQVIGNWQERVERINTGRHLALNSSGWSLSEILCKGARSLFLGLRRLEKELGVPRFELPKKNVLEIKDFSANVIARYPEEQIIAQKRLMEFAFNPRYC